MTPHTLWDDRVRAVIYSAAICGYDLVGRTIAPPPATICWLRGDRGHGLFDEVRHSGQLRYVNGVTRRHLLYRRPSPLGHGALGRRRIIGSSVVTMYQLGLVRQAGSVTGPPRASTPDL